MILPDGLPRVTCSGAWNNLSEKHLRGAHRNWFDGEFRAIELGFRCVSLARVPR